MFQLQLFFLLHCDEWDRVVALPRHKFVTRATLLQLVSYVYQLKISNYVTSNNRTVCFFVYLKYESNKIDLLQTFVYPYQVVVYGISM